MLAFVGIIALFIDNNFKNQPYVRELLFKDNNHKKRTAYKAMSSGKITVGARKTATRVRAIKNKNPLQKKNTMNYLLQRFYYYTLVICLSKTI